MRTESDGKIVRGYERIMRELTPDMNRATLSRLVRKRCSQLTQKERATVVDLACIDILIRRNGKRCARKGTRV